MERDDFLGTILDILPYPLFVVNDDVCILWSNRVGMQMVNATGEMIIRRRAGEVLHCLHAGDSPAGCGRGEFCGDCLVRNAVTMAIEGQQVVRHRAKMELVHNGAVKNIHLLVTATPFNYQEEDLAVLMLEDIGELIAIRQLLPICAHCKKIRDDQEYWQSVEKYFSTQLDLGFTHGICPECAAKYFGREKMSLGAK